MIQKPKGTYDVYGEKSITLLEVEKLMNALMENYGYEYVRTPIFEASELFHRGVGETSDIVTKETYDFKDRGDRNMTLRPEGTAGIVRSYIENKRYGEAKQPIKTWYYGTMYRYERPQAGRYRELSQFGVEVFGSTDPILDAEVISIPVHFYQLLGLKGIKVKMNSLGDKESREAYRKALLDFFKPYIEDLCDDCKARYEKNPLRILDCKVDHDKECMKHAPKMTDYLNDSSKEHFLKVQEYLTYLEIPFEVDPNIVRGLDYYTHTVFEVEADIEGFGSNNVLCGGGRYDHLIEQLDGPATPGVGFAMGVERLLIALELEGIQFHDEGLDCYVVPMKEDYKKEAFSLTNALRMSGFKTDMDPMNRSLKSNFKQADYRNAHFVMILGEEEINDQFITIKDNHNKKEHKVKMDDLIDFLDECLERCECDED